MPLPPAARAVAAVPGPLAGHGVGGVCQAARGWPWASAEVSGTLYASRGHHESAPPRARGRTGDLSVERLCPWQPSTADDPRCGRVPPAVPAPYLARRLPAAPPIWVAGEPGPSGAARAVSGAAPAAGECPIASASCHSSGSNARPANSDMSGVPVWTAVLGGNLVPPARALREVDVSGRLEYLLTGQRDGAMAGCAGEALTQDVCPAQHTRTPSVRLGAEGPCLSRSLAYPALGPAAPCLPLGAPHAMRVEAAPRVTLPQGLEAISIATALRSSNAIGTAQGQASAHRGSLWPEPCR
jgi:hypothetical protein